MEVGPWILIPIALSIIGYIVNECTWGENKTKKDSPFCPDEDKRCAYLWPTESCAQCTSPKFWAYESKWVWWTIKLSRFMPWGLTLILITRWFLRSWPKWRTRTGWRSEFFSAQDKAREESRLAETKSKLESEVLSLKKDKEALEAALAEVESLSGVQP